MLHCQRHTDTCRAHLPTKSSPLTGPVKIRLAKNFEQNEYGGRSKPGSQKNFERNKQSSSISLHKRWPWKHASVTRTLLVGFYRAGWVPEWPSGRPGAFDFM